MNPLDLIAELSNYARVFAQQIGSMLQLRLTFSDDLFSTVQTALFEVVQLLRQPSALILQILVLIFEELYLLLKLFDVDIVIVRVHEASSNWILG